jgi:hypothetical protein
MMNRVVHDKKTTGRLLGRVKKAASNAFHSKNHANQEPSNDEIPSHRSRRASRRDKNDHDNTRSLLEKHRSSLIDEILGTAPRNASRSSLYSLGEVGEDEHMMSINGFEEALVAVAQLKEMDHAFVQRSDGTWRHSVVVATSKGLRGDPFIKFLVDDKGHTKEIPLKQWTRLIRLPKNIDDDENLDSQADLNLSSMAVHGGEPFGSSHFRKNNSDPEVQASRRAMMEDRKSESCIPKPRRIPSRRRQKVSPVSASFTSSSLPQDFGMRRDSDSTCATTTTNRLSFRQRYSDMDSLKGSWRLSAADTDPSPENACFNIKFNQHAFLSALASISETSQPL